MNNTDSKTQPGTEIVDDPPAYGFPDIAALLVLMLRNLDPDGKAYNSFDCQLKNSTELLPDRPKFKDALLVASFLYGKQPALFDNVHNGIRALLEELERTKTDENVRWSICAFLSQEQLKRIGRL